MPRKERSVKEIQGKLKDSGNAPGQQTLSSFFRAKESIRLNDNNPVE